MLASQVGLDAALDQLLQRADGQPEAASQPEADRDDESATPLSLEEIGGHFGGRDHSTVLYAIDKIRKKSESDPEFAERVALLEKQAQQ